MTEETGGLVLCERMRGCAIAIVLCSTKYRAVLSFKATPGFNIKINCSRATQQQLVSSTTAVVAETSGFNPHKNIAETGCYGNPEVLRIAGVSQILSEETLAKSWLPKDLVPCDMGTESLFINLGVDQQTTT